MDELVLFIQQDYVAQITLNRPQSRNALSSELLKQLAGYVNRLKSDAKTRVLIITGAQDKAFCAGADLKERALMSDVQTLAYLNLIQSTFQNIAELPMPVVAALNGDAYGGGLELALACDIRIAASHAHMGLSECSLGIIPGAGGTQRLPRIVGLAKACELIFTAERLSAQKALALGLINYHVLENDDLMIQAHALANIIASNAPLALRAAKKALLGPHQESLKIGLAYEHGAYCEILKTYDRKEGLKAFAEKRKPEFKGC